MLGQYEASRRRVGKHTERLPVLRATGLWQQHMLSQYRTSPSSIRSLSTGYRVAAYSISVPDIA
eukprot:1152666-Rhodomonas_salina.2